MVLILKFGAVPFASDQQVVQNWFSWGLDSRFDVEFKSFPFVGDLLVVSKVPEKICKLFILDSNFFTGFNSLQLSTELHGVVTCTWVNRCKRFKTVNPTARFTDQLSFADLFGSGF